MQTTSDPEGEQAALNEDERWKLTNHVLESETFRRSPRLRAFLLYIVENTLRGRGGSLNEHLIGIEVFSRPTEYNPLEDSIVRSSARQLRAKLHEFFETEGSAEAIILDVPKGGYVPDFVPRSPAPPLPILEQASETVAVTRGMRPREWAWMASTAFLAVILAFMAIRDRSAARADAAANPLQNLIFSVFPHPEEITVVLCDTDLVTLNDSRSSLLSLEEYIRDTEQGQLASPVGYRLAASSSFHRDRIVTSFRDAVFAAELATLAEPKGYRIEIRQSRLMHTWDFRSGDFVIVGGIASNPWVQLFEDRFNFQFGVDPEAGLFGLRNLHPMRGERRFYWSSNEQWRNGESQARIALTSNLSGNGKVLLISGDCSESSEGATEAALSTDFLNSVKRATHTPLRSLSQFELIADVASVDGVVRNRKLIASRFP